jgi:hypothetical protein
VNGGLDGVMINGRMYDYVIWCVGYRNGSESLANLAPYTVSDRQVARKALDGIETYAIGPAAQLEMGSYETEALPSAVPENTVALFRYADRTATLANELEEVK